MKKLASLTICLMLAACGEPASKQNSTANNDGSNNASNNANNNSSNNVIVINNGGSNNGGSNNGGSNNIIIVVNNANNTNNNTLGGSGDPCGDGVGCEEGLRCQSAEERAWNFCGAPMEPDCAETEVGDSCGNCFLACSSDDDCDGQTCNGTYCIGPQTCAEELPPPP